MGKAPETEKVTALPPERAGPTGLLVYLHHIKVLDRLVSISGVHRANAWAPIQQREGPGNSGTSDSDIQHYRHH